MTPEHTKQRHLLSHPLRRHRLNLADWRHALFAALALTALIVVMVLYVDRRVALCMYGLDPSTKDFFQRLTFLGRSEFYLVPAGLLTLLGWGLKWRRLLVPAGFVFAVQVVNGLAVTVIKFLIGRARPKLFLEGDGLYTMRPFGFSADWYSFPSGHSNTAMALVLSLMLLWPRGRWFFLAFGVFIAVSRVVTHAHFVSDMVAGMLLAAILTHFTFAYFQSRKWF